MFNYNCAYLTVDKICTSSNHSSVVVVVYRTCEHGLNHTNKLGLQAYCVTLRGSE